MQDQEVARQDRHAPGVHMHMEGLQVGHGDATSAL
jgi:hypothetical protein